MDDLSMLVKISIPLFLITYMKRFIYYMYSNRDDAKKQSIYTRILEAVY